MRILVLCIDRDDDIGSKAHLKGPFIGREANHQAAVALALSDPEDPDSNTIFSAISVYDELLRRGMDVQVATIAGSRNVGIESDTMLAGQLEDVISIVKPDRAVLVSNGAEDEFFYPVVSSRIKIDSVRRVFIKQTPTVEGVYYILLKTLKDKEMRRRLFAPLSVILMAYGILLMLSDMVALSKTHSIGYISGIAPGLITFVVGLYLLWYAFDTANTLRRSFRRAWNAVRSGSQTIPFAVISMIMVIVGALYSYTIVTSARNVELPVLVLIFISNFLWISVFAAVIYGAGRFAHIYFSTREISWSTIIAGLMILAMGLIVQGALDVIKVIYHIATVSAVLITVEISAGVLTTLYCGILNLLLPVSDENAESVAKGNVLESGNK